MAAVSKLAIISSIGLAGVACSEPPKDPSAAPGAKVGSPAPALDLPAAAGSGRVAIPKGKVVVVDFWATWCGPCEKSFPHYRDLYVKYKASGLEIVAVSVDDEGDRSKIPAWLKSHGDPKFLVAWDETKTAAKTWGVGQTMPTAFVVDKDGVVRHVHASFKDGEEAVLEKEIKALL